MKKIMRNIAVTVGCMLLLTHCATQDQVSIMQNQLRALNMKIKEQEQTIQRLKKESAREQLSSVSVIDQVKDESLQHREEMQEEMRRLQDEIEKLQNSLGSVSAENQQKVTSLSTQVADLNRELVEERRKAQLMEAERRKTQLAAAEERARETARRAEEAKKRANAATSMSLSSSQGTTFVRLAPSSEKKKVTSAKNYTSPSTAGTSVNRGSSPEIVQPVSNKPVRFTPVETPPAANPPVVKAPDEARQTAGGASSSSGALAQAMDQYKNQKYQDAYKTFEEVLSAGPSASDAAKALFYMGECLYAQKEYDLAILDYQKVISNHSKHPLVPNALLKQGMSFEKLTDHETAKMIYKKLISTYSGSKEAKEAQSKLDKL